MGLILRWAPSARLSSGQVSRIVMTGGRPVRFVTARHRLLGAGVSGGRARQHQGDQPGHLAVGRPQPVHAADLTTMNAASRVCRLAALRIARPVIPKIVVDERIPATACRP